MKASVGTCTVPRFRIFFVPAPHKSKLLWGPRIRFKWPEMNSVHFKVLPAAKRLDAALAAGRQKNQSLSSLRTAMKASVGTCTVPRFRIFFLPSFCFSSSFFLRVISPP